MGDAIKIPSSAGGMDQHYTTIFLIEDNFLIQHVLEPTS